MGGVDPDIAGIVPGPQPLPWEVEGGMSEEAAEGEEEETRSAK
jgi:hypothetical protein